MSTIEKLLAQPCCVAILARNAEHCILRAIASASNVFQVRACVLVNFASCDRTVPLVEEFCLQHSVRLDVIQSRADPYARRSRKRSAEQWQNFAYYKNLALERAQQMRARFTLLLEPEYVVQRMTPLSTPPITKDVLSALSFSVRMQSGGFELSRQVLFDSDTDWYYMGVAHEYVQRRSNLFDPAQSPALEPYVIIEDRINTLHSYRSVPRLREICVRALQRRSRHATTCVRLPEEMCDALKSAPLAWSAMTRPLRTLAHERFTYETRVLRRALTAAARGTLTLTPLLENRYRFYLAQSLRDAGDMRGAIRAYQSTVHRENLGYLFLEQRWYAEYMAAGLSFNLYNDRDQGKSYTELLRVYHQRPHRLEPLEAIARHYAHATMLSYMYSSVYTDLAPGLQYVYDVDRDADQKQFSPGGNDVLFIDHGVYRWRFAYWMFRLAHNACAIEHEQRLAHALLRNPFLPAAEREACKARCDAYQIVY